VSLSKIILAALVVLAPLAAQLTPDQREADLTALANYYAKYYVPANWKMVAFSSNPLDLRAGDYIRRARQAPNDLAYFEVVREYVASLRDGHSSIGFPSNFAADLGIRVDLYDGKPLIDGVNRARYPLADYPSLVPGTEVISIDGVPATQLIADVAKLNLVGSGRASRRFGAVYLGFRPQSALTFAVDTPDESDVVVETQEGLRETLRLKWTKTGEPVRNFGRTPSPVLKANRAANDQSNPETNFLAKVAVDAVPGHLALPPRLTTDLFGNGARIPYYALPTGFVTRRGRLSTDFTYSGTYVADGLRIGFIRLPNFSPTDTVAAILELRSEIAFLKANTDGLVIDCSHNNGGSPALGAEFMSMLTVTPYYIAPRQFLPSVRDVVSQASLLEALKTLGAPTWVQDRWGIVGEQLRASLASGPRALTGPVSAIIPASESQLTRGPLEDDNPPLRVNNAPFGYDKPLIVLIDDFSLSHGEIFPGTVQDNERGLLVGVRTGGLGASVGCTTTLMPYSEAQNCNSFSLVMRRKPIRSPDFPEAPYVENIGVFPDVELDFQTRENLLNNGRPFVAGFTQVIVEQIRKGR